MSKPIHSLSPGRPFRLAGMPYKTGTLLRVGVGSAVVRYDGIRRADFEARMPGETKRVAFEAPLRDATISLNTLVEDI